eukprot:TRINITY_DN817_c1_g1_i1.p1 TRINITY_DN817_c1_g1~~TRINITY_DN817_c1_g1_i1.p1  ORF type:complete len:242 (+),score=55.15 TRINITY_DN817_c1_g1_i1:450-1175(+)
MTSIREGDDVVRKSWRDVKDGDDQWKWYPKPMTCRVEVDDETENLVVSPFKKTDYWQKTHYGFRVDNGPMLGVGVDLSVDFDLCTTVSFQPKHQYDQAGLIVRFSSDFWIKTSVEYEGPDQPAKLGAVVTNNGYSDWSTQDYGGERVLCFRIQKRGLDFSVHFAPASSSSSSSSPSSSPDCDVDISDDSLWTQLRVCHLHLDDITQGQLQAGIYCCSPIDEGFQCHFQKFHLHRRVVDKSK